MSQYTGGITGPRVREYLWFDPSAPKITRPKTALVAVNRFPSRPEPNVDGAQEDHVVFIDRIRTIVDMFVQLTVGFVRLSPADVEIMEQCSIISNCETLLAADDPAASLKLLEGWMRANHRQVSSGALLQFMRVAAAYSSPLLDIRGFVTISISAWSRVIKLISEKALRERHKGLLDPAVLDAFFFLCHTGARITGALAEAASISRDAAAGLMEGKRALLDLLTCGMLDLETAPLSPESKARIAGSVLCMTVSMNYFDRLSSFILTGSELDLFTPSSFESLCAMRRGATHLMLQAFNYIQGSKPGTDCLGPDFAPLVLSGSEAQGSKIMLDAHLHIYRYPAHIQKSFLPLLVNFRHPYSSRSTTPSFFSSLKNASLSSYSPLSDSNLSNFSTLLNRVLLFPSLHPIKITTFDSIMHCVLFIPHSFSSEFMISRFSQGLSSPTIIKAIFVDEVLNQKDHRSSDTYIKLVSYFLMDPRLAVISLPHFQDFFEILKRKPRGQRSATERATFNFFDVLLSARPSVYEEPETGPDFDFASGCLIMPLTGFKRVSQALSPIATNLTSAAASVAGDPFVTGEFGHSLQMALPVVRRAQVLLRGSANERTPGRLEIHAVTDATYLTNYLREHPLPKLVAALVKMLDSIPSPVYLPGSSLLMTCYDFIAEMQHLLLHTTKFVKRILAELRMRQSLSLILKGGLTKLIRDRKADLKRFKAAVDTFRNKYSAVYG